MKKINWIKILKISIGSSVAVLLANVIGLQSATSAGIITLLSIQNTKKETLSIAFKRVLAFFIAVAVAFLLFRTMGFHLVTFGLFLFVFTFLCYLIHFEVAVSMNTVLILHFWSARSFTFPLLVNEFLLLCIGLSIAVLINLYMPRNLEDIRAYQQKIDGNMRGMLLDIAGILSGEGKAELEQGFEGLNRDLEKALAKAYHNMNNTLAVDMRYYVEYLEMRRGQCELLRRIYENAVRMQWVPTQAKCFAQFLSGIAQTFHEYNNAAALLESLLALRKQFKTSGLPQCRKEFEARALLYQIANDTEYLLLAKKRFSEGLSEWQIQYFWKEGSEAEGGNLLRRSVRNFRKKRTQKPS